MADIDVERKENNKANNKNNNSKWWILIVLVIIGIIVLWFAFSDRTNVDSQGGPDVEDNLHIQEPDPASAEPTAQAFPERDIKEIV